MCGRGFTKIRHHTPAKRTNDNYKLVKYDQYEEKMKWKNDNINFYIKRNPNKSPENLRASTASERSLKLNKQIDSHKTSKEEDSRGHKRDIFLEFSLKPRPSTR